MENNTRESILKEPFNIYWNDFFKTNKDYFSDLSLQQFINLKKVLSGINNIITLKTTFLFIDFLGENEFVDSQQVRDIKDNINTINANTNGFDVQIQGKNLPKILAEVKCNIPVKEETFGAAQLSSIKKDIKGLLKGKTKAHILHLNDYYKFMVCLQFDGVEQAMKKTINSLQKEKFKIKEYTNKEAIETDVVYVVYISM